MNNYDKERLASQLYQELFPGNGEIIAWASYGGGPYEPLRKRVFASDIPGAEQKLKQVIGLLEDAIVFTKMEIATCQAAKVCFTQRLTEHCLSMISTKADCEKALQQLQTLQAVHK